MLDKLLYSVVLGVFLVVGYLTGDLVAQLLRAPRWVCVVMMFIGGVVFLIGEIEANTDRRFFFLMAAGMSLKVASFVSTSRVRRYGTRRSVDLWNAKKRL